MRHLYRFYQSSDRAPAKANREHIDYDYSRKIIMAKFMNEYDRRQHSQERHDIH